MSVLRLQQVPLPWWWSNPKLKLTDGAGAKFGKIANTCKHRIFGVKMDRSELVTPPGFYVAAPLEQYTVLIMRTPHDVKRLGIQVSWVSPEVRLHLRRFAYGPCQLGIWQGYLSLYKQIKIMYIETFQAGKTFRCRCRGCRGCCGCCGCCGGCGCHVYSCTAPLWSQFLAAKEEDAHTHTHVCIYIFILYKIAYNYNAHTNV